MYARGWTDGLPVVPPTEAAGARDAGRHPPRARRGGRRRPARPRASARSRRSPSTPCWPAACPSTCPWCSPRSRPPARTPSTCTACWRRRCRPAPVLVVNGPVAQAARHEQRRQRARPGQPRQRDDRPRAAARRPQRRRRPARRGRPGDAGSARQAHRRASPRTRRARPSTRCPSSRGVARASAVTLFAGSGCVAGRRPASAAPPSRWRAASPLALRSRRPPQARHRLRRAAGAQPGARPRPPRGRLGPRPAARRAGRAAHRAGRRAHAAASTASPRACRPASRPSRSRSSAPAGCCVAHAGGTRRAVLDHRPRLGQRRHRAASPSPSRSPTLAGVLMRVVLDPTSERAPAARQLNPRPAVARRADRRAARHLQGRAATCCSTGSSSGCAPTA